MSRLPEVSLADAIRVARGLAPGHRRYADLRATLGLAAPTPHEAAPPDLGVGPAPLPEPGRRPPEDVPRRPAPPSRADAAPAPFPTSEDEPTPRPTELIAAPEPPEPPPAPRPARPVDLLVDVPATFLPVQDLFLPRQQRAIVGALCASERRDGDIDVDHLVVRLSEGAAITVLPRRPVLTTRAGVRLLIDVGAGMLPFREDAERLAVSVQRVVGRDGLEVLYFDASPLAETGAGAGPIWTWEPYKAAVPGRPVVVVTDLGLGGRTPSPGLAAGAWRRFTQMVEAQGGALTFLVPYPPERWPDELRRSATIVRWDRVTDVRSVLHVTRRATS